MRRATSHSNFAGCHFRPSSEQDREVEVTHSAFWLDLLKFAVGTGVFGYMARSLFGLWISRDIERYKSTLAMEHSNEIERLKADLRAAAFEHETRFARLHEKRIEIVAELYRKLAIAEDAFHDVLHPIQPGSRDDHKCRTRQAAIQAQTFFTFFNQNRVFLDDQLCGLILAIKEKLRRISAEFAGALDFTEVPSTHEQWTEAWKLFSTNVPPLRSEIEQRVRKMLGAVPA
jgi:hypothetical protein